jgi:hypothetical protein
VAIARQHKPAGGVAINQAANNHCRDCRPGDADLDPLGAAPFQVAARTARAESAPRRAACGSGDRRSSRRSSVREAMDRIAAGEAVAEVARTFGINRATVYRLRPSTPE